MKHIPAEVIDTIRSMAAAGHSDTHIAATLGRTPMGIKRLRNRRRIPAGGTVRAHRIQNLPTTPDVADEIDEAAVARLMAGDTTIPLYRLRPGSHGRPLSLDVVEAMRRLAGHGLNDREISDRLHRRISADAVLKARQRYGIAAGYWRTMGVAA